MAHMPIWSPKRVPLSKFCPNGEESIHIRPMVLVLRLPSRSPHPSALHLGPPGFHRVSMDDISDLSGAGTMEGCPDGPDPASKLLRDVPTPKTPRNSH